MKLNTRRVLGPRVDMVPHSGHVTTCVQWIYADHVLYVLDLVQGRRKKFFKGGRFKCYFSKMFFLH